MFGNQKCKVCIFCAKIRAVIAVSVYRHNTIGIFIYHDTVWIHTERTDIILKLFRTVNNLALIKFIGQMGKDHCRKFYPHTDIHTVGFGRNFQILTDILHPLASASSNRHDTFSARIFCIFCRNCVTVLFDLNLLHRGIKEKVHVFLHLVIEIFQHHIIDIRAQMTNRCIQKLQLILQTHFF